MEPAVSDRKTILLVEDEAVVRLDEARMLRGEGYEVIAASSGEKAIAAVREIPGIDLILMDIDLGRGMDGTEAAQVILEDHDIPVVFLSSHSEKNMVDKTEKTPSYGYVVKGSAVSVLNASIRMAFKLHEAHERLKKREDALRKSEEKFSRIFHQSSICISLTTMADGRFVDVNDAWSRTLGYSRENVIGMRAGDFGIWKNLSDREKCMAELGEKGEVIDCEVTLMKSFGEGVFLLSGRAVDIDEEKCILWELRDITDRRNAEESLRTSRLHLAEAADLAKIAYWEHDEAAREFIFNDALYALYGTTSEKEGGYRLPWEEYFARFVHPEDREELRRQVAENRAHPRSGDVWQYEHRAVRRDGEVIHILTRISVVMGQDGRILRAVGVNQDITVRKKTEEALRESEERYHSLVESSIDGIMLTRPDGAVLAANKQARQMFRMTEEEVLRAGRAGIVVDDERLRAAVAERAKTGKWQGELTFRRSDGSTFPVEISSNVFVGADGSQMTAMILRDITERKRMEQALHESEERYQRLFLEMSYGAALHEMVTDGEGNAVDYVTLEVNRTFESLLDCEKEAVVGKRASDVLPPDELRKWLGIFGPVALLGESCHYELYSPLNKKHLEGTAYSPAKGKFAVVFSDVTERKHAADRIANLLSEKELLLREVHHRIKNNVSMIMSLLSLQSGRLEDPTATEGLEKARTRLQSMMVLYDRLYRSTDFRKLSAREYLSSLIDEIVGNLPFRGSVKIEKRIDDVFLDAGTLSPVGMILNELLTNAMKHAFTGRDEGVVTVSLSSKDRHIELIVEDDGTGVPESVDIERSTGFGLQLVGILSEQLEGTVRIEREKGTRLILQFDT